MESRVRVSVRWRDLDMLGHLNQAVYHELLEEGRGALMGKIGIVPFVLARVELDYRSEVRHDHGEVEVVTRPESVGRSSVVVAQQILLPDGTIAAEGRCVLVAWDPQERRSRQFTDAERAQLSDNAPV